MSNDCMITNQKNEVNDRISLLIHGGALRGEAESRRLRVESALNQARDMRLAGHPRADEAGRRAMIEYIAFRDAVGEQRVELLVPDADEPQTRMTAKRRQALGDAQRIFRWQKRLQRGFAAPAPATA